MICVGEPDLLTFFKQIRVIILSVTSRHESHLLLDILVFDLLLLLEFFHSDGFLLGLRLLRFDHGHLLFAQKDIVSDELSVKFPNIVWAFIQAVEVYCTQMRRVPLVIALWVFES